MRTPPNSVMQLMRQNVGTTLVAAVLAVLLAGCARSGTGEPASWTTYHSGRATSLELPLPVTDAPAGIVLFQHPYWAVKVERVIVDGEPLKPEPLILSVEADPGSFRCGQSGHVYVFRSHPIWTTESHWALVFETDPLRADRYRIRRDSLNVDLRYHIAYKGGGVSASRWLRSTNINDQDLTTRPTVLPIGVAKQSVP